MRTPYHILLIVCLSFACLTYCGPLHICTPQEVVACACSENKAGTKICSDDGSQFSTCSCPQNEKPQEQPQEETSPENPTLDETSSEQKIELPKEETPDDAGQHEEFIKEPTTPEPEPTVEKECTPNKSRSCYTGGSKTKDVGECKAGQQICSKEGAWSLCTGQTLPKTESCNGKDDDCNGTIDDTYPEKGKACDTQKPGICKDGLYQCTNGTLECIQTNSLKTEECNNIDDDCDGKIDEELKRYCYSGPSQTEGIGLCRRGAQTCTLGKWGICSGDITPQSEVCNGKDDDCNGTVDDSTATTLCPTNQACASGVCYTQCQEDTECPNKSSCQNNLCKALSCQSPMQACVHECVDTKTNEKHCGSCGNTCSGDELCQNSTCLCDANTSLTCNGTCTNINFNDQHCGACNQACTNSTFCFQKKCSNSWARDILLWRYNVPNGIRAITVDSYGNTYIGGYFEKNATFGSTTITTPNFDTSSSAFLAKLDKNGRWLWAKRVIHSSADQIHALTSDDQGNIYVSGLLGTGGKFGNINPGNGPVFIAKMNAAGNWLWAHSVSSYCKELKYQNGALYILGVHDGGSFGTIKPKTYGGDDIFVGKIATNTGKWAWVSSAGSPGFDIVEELGIDANGNLYITSGVGKNAVFGNSSLHNTKGTGVLAKLDSTGKWLWVKPVPSGSLAIDSQGNIYTSGTITKNVSIGSFSITVQGSRDLYVAKFASDGKCTWAKSAGISGGSTGSSKVFAIGGAIYIIGASNKALKLGSDTLDTKKGVLFEAKISEQGSWVALKQRMNGNITVYTTTTDHTRMIMGGWYSGSPTIDNMKLPLVSTEGVVWSLPTF